MTVRTRSQLERLFAAAEEFSQLGSWQQDLRSGETVWSDGMYRILDLAPEQAGRSLELILDVIHPHDRPRVRAMLETVSESPESIPDEGLTAELRLVRGDGSVRHTRIRGHVEYEGGLASYWVGVLQDVTEQRLTEGELQAHYAVSQALRDWESFEEGVIDLLRRVGTALDYPMGSLWLWDDDQDALACRAFWSAPTIDPDGFEEAKRRLVFPSGKGKPGIAWRTQQPVLTRVAATDPQFAPRDAALARGVSSAVTFPAVGFDGPVAVLSFYSLEPRVPSESLVRTLTGIGRELGRFLSRRAAQLAPHPLTAREREVLGLAANGNSTREIAEQLFVSPATIKTHLEHIYEKLGVSDRAAAVAQGLRTGLIS
jgi:DNA-binding CsgD family transcriptional regulator